MRTTIVLVHGAFAESASWNGVIEPLVAEGHRVVAAPNGFAPESGENCFGLAGMFAGSMLGEETVRAATQRPATQEALVEPSGEHLLWKDVPACFPIGGEDRVIPAELQRDMAHRARSQRTTVIEGASHAMPVSRPGATVHPILEAAALRATA